jgi:hypothetical protein
MDPVPVWCVLFGVYWETVGGALVRKLLHIVIMTTNKLYYHYINNSILHYIYIYIYIYIILTEICPTNSTTNVPLRVL